MLLGIDIDGVVADFDTVASEWIEQHFGYPRFEHTEWDWFKRYPDWKMVKRAFWRAVEDEHLLVTCNPIKGAVESLHRLWDDGFDIVFVTHRGENLAEDTECWLRNLDLPTTVHYLEDKWTIGADSYLDDKPENVQSCLENDCFALLLAQPWNASAQRHLPCVRSWAEYEWLLTVQWESA